MPVFIDKRKFKRTNNDVTMKVCVRKPGENIRRHPIKRNQQTRGKYGEFQLAPACDLHVSGDKLKVYIYQWNTKSSNSNPFDVQGKSIYTLPLDYVEVLPKGNGFIVETPEFTWEFVSFYNFWKYEYHADLNKISALLQEIREAQQNNALPPSLDTAEESNYAGVC